MIKLFAHFGAPKLYKSNRCYQMINKLPWSCLWANIWFCLCFSNANITFESEVSAEEESDKDLNEVDADMPLPSPPCWRLTPLLEGVGVLLRDCAWLWGDGFFSFLKGSSITVGPPGSFGGPLADDVQLESLGCGWELTPFLEIGRPKPPSMDWILRSCAGSSFWEEEYCI